MPWPGNHAGTADSAEYSDIQRLISDFHDQLGISARAHRILPGRIPFLRHANTFVLADPESVHIVISNDPTQTMPLAMIRDVPTALDPRDAGSVIQQTQGWGECMVVSLPRSLVDQDTATRHDRLKAEADEYVEGVVQQREEERRLEALVGLMKLKPDTHAAMQPYVQSAIADSAYDRSVFIMIRYQDSPQFSEIVQQIKLAVEAFGLRARLAKDKAYAPLLWNNVQAYMLSCKYGIAVFENIDTQSFNPNVSIELGFMFGIGKPILLLKEQRANIPTDMVGHLYKGFDMFNLLTVREQVGHWLETDLGIPRLSDSTPDS